MRHQLSGFKNVLLVVAAVTASGCANPSFPMSPIPTPTLSAGTRLPLETLAHGELCNYFEPEVRPYFVTSLSELESVLSGMFEPNPHDKVLPTDILETDFTQYTVIAALRTCKGRGGYDIEVKAAIWREDENRLLIYTELTDARYAGGTQMPTGYYHIVKVPWTGPPAEDRAVEFVIYPVFQVP